MSRVSPPIVSCSEGIPCRSTTFNFTWSMFPRECPMWSNHSLMVHLQTRSMMAERCSYQLTQSWAQCASPKLLHHHLQMHLIRCSIMASTCICLYTWSWALSSYPNWLYHSLQIDLTDHLTSGLMCISTLAIPSPPSAFLHSLQRCLQVHLSVHSILGTSASPSSLDHALQMDLWTSMITASMCISLFSRSWALSATPTRSLMASKWVTKLALSWPPCAHLSSLDHCLLAHLELCSAAPLAASSDIPFADGQLHRNIDT